MVYRSAMPCARQDSRVVHTLELVNPREVPIQIARITSSCGCTTVENIVGRVIGGGQKICVPITVDLRGKEGRYQSTVGLYIVGATKPVLLQMEGEVYREHPTTVEFGEVTRGMPVERTFAVQPFPGQQNVHIERCQFPKEYFVLSMKKARRQARRN